MLMQSDNLGPNVLEQLSRNLFPILECSTVTPVMLSYFWRYGEVPESLSAGVLCLEFGSTTYSYYVADLTAPIVIILLSNIWQLWALKSVGLHSTS
jgi:hypothetical protein